MVELHLPACLRGAGHFRFRPAAVSPEGRRGPGGDTGGDTGQGRAGYRQHRAPRAARAGPPLPGVTFMGGRERAALPGAW